MNVLWYIITLPFFQKSFGKCSRLCVCENAIVLSYCLDVAFIYFAASGCRHHKVCLRCELWFVHIVSFTWQEEQDSDTLLSSSVRIASLRVVSLSPPPSSPPPLATPSNSLPPPFTRWLLMLRRVRSWT